MALEALQARQKELEIALANTTQSFHILSGHKAEVDYQIDLLLKCEPKVDAEAIAEAELVLE